MTLNNKVKEIDSIKNELVTCHSELKKNLLSKNVQIQNSDKLLTLINKVMNITVESLGGMNFSSGTVSVINDSPYVEYLGTTNTTRVSHSATVSGLKFEPKFIFAFLDNGLYENLCISVYVKDFHPTIDGSARPAFGLFVGSKSSLSSSSSSGGWIKHDAGDVYVRPSEFKLPMFAGKGNLCKWYAFG